MLGDEDEDVAEEKASKIGALLKGSDAEPDEEDSSDEVVGAALLEALDAKDAKQIGAALRDAVRLCKTLED